MRYPNGLGGVVCGVVHDRSGVDVPGVVDEQQCEAVALLLRYFRIGAEGQPNFVLAWQNADDEHRRR